MQQQQQTQAARNPTSAESTAEAPPKQVALAMDRLAQAARLIADVRLGADRLLEALFVSAQPHQTTKPLHLFLKEDSSMRQHLQDLRTIGKQLEDSGVLNESLRSRSNSWGLHMPLVCPDGAVVAYAWKRQLAGQAGASAVDRTRLALKAFTDQKRRFFPHLDDGLNGQSSASESVPKKHCGSQISTVTQQEELSDYRTLSDVLMHVEKDMPNMKIFTYQRLDWLKRASTLPCSAEEFLMDSSKEHDFHISNKPRLGLLGAVAADKVAVIELLFPSIFRAIISLHPAGSIDPDAVAFFSPDELGSHYLVILIYEASLQTILGFSIVEAVMYMPEVFQFIMYLNMSRSTLLWPCNIFLEPTLKQHCILFCTGSSAIKPYLQNLAVNVNGYCQWIDNQIYCYLLFTILIEASALLKVHLPNQYPQQRTRLWMLLTLIMLVAFQRKHSHIQCRRLDRLHSLMIEVDDLSTVIPK